MRAAELLRERGIAAVHVTEIADASTEDIVILEDARTTGRIVVTLDTDFHAWLALHGWSAPSVIRIRRQGLSAEDVRDLVIHLLSDHEPALLSGVALSVRAHLVGIRRLPLTDVPAEPADPKPDE